MSKPVAALAAGRLIGTQPYERGRVRGGAHGRYVARTSAQRDLKGRRAIARGRTGGNRTRRRASPLRGGDGASAGIVLAQRIGERHAGVRQIAVDLVALWLR